MRLSGKETKATLFSRSPHEGSLGTEGRILGANHREILASASHELPGQAHAPGFGCPHRAPGLENTAEWALRAFQARQSPGLRFRPSPLQEQELKEEILRDAED